MYKLYLTLISVLTFVACTKSTPVVSPTGAIDQEDCKRLYHHILVMAVVNDVGMSFSARDFDSVMWTVDQLWQQEGKTERFMHSCLQMSTDQFLCAMDTKQVADITTCIKLQPGIKHAKP